MAEDFLSTIIANKKARIKKQIIDLPIDELKEKVAKTDYIRRLFKEALIKKPRVSIIAEIKKASPSAGILREEFNPVAIANIYQDAGVDAISVLTEEEFFTGAPYHIKSVRDSVALPILRKDFIIDDYQIYESYILGADAILLITAILSTDQIKQFLKTAEDVGLECLVEVHNEVDLKKALDANAQIIGINNRNLKTLEVDITTTPRLIADIPKDKIVVSESGIKSPEDIKRLADLEIDSALIGETFMRSDDIKATVQDFIIHQT